jgi:type III secretory pathway lipoprotein EscJ
LRWFVVLAIYSCAPDVPSARERADLSDRGEAAQLDRQLRAVPGVTGAYAAIHTAFTDPLTNAHTGSAASVLIAIAPDADRAAIEAAAHQLAPNASLAIVTSPAQRRSYLAWIAALVAVLAAAGALAFRYRPRK